MGRLRALEGRGLTERTTRPRVTSSAGSVAASGSVDGIGAVVRLAKVLEIVLAEIGLTMNQFRFMELVSEGSPSTAELSLRLVMKPPNVSAMTAALVERGLVRQTRQAGDGRRRDLSLTDTGDDLLARAHAACGAALRLLADERDTGEDLVESLAEWVPALDRAAVRLRDAADRGAEDPYGFTARPRS